MSSGLHSRRPTGCALFYAHSTLSATERLLLLENVCESVSYHLYEYMTSATKNSNVC